VSRVLFLPVSNKTYVHIYTYILDLIGHTNHLDNTNKVAMSRETLASVLPFAKRLPPQTSAKLWSGAASSLVVRLPQSSQASSQGFVADISWVAGHRHRFRRKTKLQGGFESERVNICIYIYGTLFIPLSSFSLWWSWDDCIGF
jgi:hypothetical protein